SAPPPGTCGRGARRARRVCRYQPSAVERVIVDRDKAIDCVPEDPLLTIRISTAARRWACSLLGVLACLATGCGSPTAGSRAATAAPADFSAPAASPAPATSPGSSSPPRMAVGGVLVISPPESALAPVEPVLREPTA